MIRYIGEIEPIKWGEGEEIIARYKNVPGVWILVGRRKVTGKPCLECLQVAKCNDIGGEINRDTFYLKAEKSEPVPKDYVNQFGEHIFEYREYPNRAKLLYKDIAENYKDLIFICVAYGDELKDDSLRKDIEKYVAYRTLCRYWVNGGQYKKKEIEEIKSIKEKCKEQCQALFENIKEKYGEKADSMDKFLGSLIDGTFDDNNFEKDLKIDDTLGC